MTTLVIIAKQCLPGRVKTRLHPPFSLADAARIAHASLTDTLNAADTLPATRRILFFEGDEPPVEASDYEVWPQPQGSLDERIGSVFDACSGPTVLIGMDTPQIAASNLGCVFEPWPQGTDAWFGPAADGGFWALALAEPRGDLVRGVPMSRRDTGSIQRKRLVDAGLQVRDLPELTDIDTVRSLEDVVSHLPVSTVAHIVDEIQRTAATEVVSLRSPLGQGLPS
ncbi:TIGR04282 family arsenosugar biosynthesis glycosyltransferase [Leifsonia sp. Root112D2]|uniref:TIGR04282 family arsenosugar biosynthesis glycosyltransferase n=1 Tax=Leifsonia sp. Root112D2 TaxID=1736426 RepID=UPI0009EAE165|nr:DUF2064 domain-containing protein [Leifsonia sp. Root112D2]